MAVVLQPANLTSTHDIITRQQWADSGSRNYYLWKRRGHGSGGRGGGSHGAASSSSSTGGQTTTGSGVAPAYGNGRFYSGGTTIPYCAGSPSTGGVVPFMLAGRLQEIAFWPGVWHPLPYLYPHEQPWYYHNQTSDRDEIKPVLCACAPYQVCGCDDNGDQAYIDSIIGNGSYGSLNHSIVCLDEVNGTDRR
ncbi:hypothetical protein F5883DRAFT_432946 [Diaporthe sp. PMI_573]|nr:hypothetical protein F5883DRAFT_432946 [Diaporthaceae sp. PMI_573]